MSWMDGRRNGEEDALRRVNEVNKLHAQEKGLLDQASANVGQHRRY